MHINIRSLPDKFDRLKKILTNLDNEKIQFDAILLCETFLTDTNHDLFNIPGYTFISRHRKHYRQGGVGIYIKNNINFIIRDDLSIFIETYFETLFLEVTSSKGNRPIIIGEVYRVPNSSCPNSITNYELITNKLQNENKEIIIGTDQNFDYLNIHCAYSKHLLETFFTACLVPTITRPTRITSESATLNDNIYVNGNRLEYLRSGILVTDISDHFPIFVFTGKHVRQCKPKNNTNSYRKLDTTAIDRINTLLLATDWSPLQQLHVCMFFHTGPSGSNDTTSCTRKVHAVATSSSSLMSLNNITQSCVAHRPRVSPCRSARSVHKSPHSQHVRRASTQHEQAKPHSDATTTRQTATTTY